jgi:DNA-binding response OmpR family regulator
MFSKEWKDDADKASAGNRDESILGSCPVIVIAEDNDDARRVYALILRHFGYRVEEATNGRDAVKLVRSVRPSLVLMDIGLPELDGFQASRLLKSDAKTSSIPLIAFSARIDSTADLVGGTPTFDGFILKPVSPQELVRRVRAYLALLGGKPKPIDRSTYRSDDADQGFREKTVSA